MITPDEWRAIDGLSAFSLCEVADDACLYGWEIARKTLKAACEAEEMLARLGKTFDQNGNVVAIVVATRH